jgi:hypothetical protein
VISLEADRASHDEYENIRLDLLEKVRAETKAIGLIAGYRRALCLAPNCGLARLDAISLPRPSR